MLENSTHHGSSHFKVIKSKKSTKQKVKKWFINHIHPKIRLPILTWLPQYKMEYLKGDIMAGLTVGLVVIPQSLAIAGIYGCPPVVGLYSSIVGPFSSLIFSTSPDNSVGPTLLVALLGSRYNPYGSNEFLSMMSFFSGIVMVLMSFFNAGVLMNLVSFTVLSAFISCGCLSIGISQLPGMFGIVIPEAGQMNSYQLFYNFCAHIAQTNYQDILVGISCVAFSLFCHMTMPWVVEQCKRSESSGGKVGWEVVRMIYIGKNVIMTGVMLVVAYIISNHFPHVMKITLVGKLPAGFPVPWNPVRSAVVTDMKGQNVTMSAIQIISDIYPSFFLAPIMMFVETLSIVKNFSKLKDYYADPTQELLNVGVANIINSFFRGYPIGGALARSTVNSISGVNTCLSGLISIFVVILTLMILTPMIFYVPKPTLAGMIVAAVLPSINFRQIGTFWRVQKWELVPWFGTMLIGLYRLELGMAAGLALSSGFILFREMRPRLHRIHHIHRDRGTFSVRLRSALHYPCAVFIARRIRSFQKRFPELTELEIDCHAMHEIDITVARELLYIVEKFKLEQNITVRFTYVKKGSVRHIMNAVGLGPFIYDDTKIAAEDCRHCHSYHNHTNFSSADNIRNTNLQSNLDTTRSAPIHIPTKLNVIKEIQDSGGKHHSTDSFTNVDSVFESNLTSSVRKPAPLSASKSVSFSRDVEKDAKRIHSSNSESSSSSSGTNDSDSYPSNDKDADDKVV